MGLDKAIENIDKEALSGYDTSDRFIASRYRQGDRWVYDIDLSLPQISALIERPDPDRPALGNRRIRRKHAEDFATYVRRNRGWVCPALHLRVAEGVLEFEPQLSLDGMEWGYAAIPRTARTDLKISDGQHRILGVHILWERIADDLQKARTHLSRAKQGGEEAVIKGAEIQVKTLLDERDRLSRERISVTIVEVSDLKEAQQIFVDIADNALGITQAVKARFDTRRIVNRCIADLLEHPLLHGRVDAEQDRVLGGNPNLLGAKHVADLVRIVEVGIAGRITARREEELEESVLVRQTREFLDTAVAGFEDLRKVAEGAATPPEIREQSILGSNVMLRLLAGVYHNLRKLHGKSPSWIQAFFARLDSFTSAPVTADSPWAATEVFQEGSFAPSARQQDLKRLTQEMTDWALDPPAWLE